jgi:hypothetical protein
MSRFTLVLMFAPGPPLSLPRLRRAQRIGHRLWLDRRPARNMLALALQSRCAEVRHRVPQPRLRLPEACTKLAPGPNKTRAKPTICDCLSFNGYFSHAS